MNIRTSGYALALGVFALDQLVKWVMTGPLALREIGQIVLLPIFSFTYAENTGVSLSLFSATNPPGAGRWSR